MRPLAVQLVPVPLTADADGVVRVGRTRVTLDSVVQAYLDGSTAEEIVDQFPALPLADIHGVIAYYLTHTKVVDEYLAERRHEAEGVRQEIERHSDPGLRRERLLARRASVRPST